jgi:hypothetical protein
MLLAFSAAARIRRVLPVLSVRMTTRAFRQAHTEVGLARHR